MAALCLRRPYVLFTQNGMPLSLIDEGSTFLCVQCYIVVLTGTKLSTVPVDNALYHCAYFMYHQARFKQVRIQNKCWVRTGGGGGIM